MQSIDEYKNTLSARMQCEKDDSEIEAEGVDEVTQIKISKHLYNRVMLWNADDFGSIIRNQDFFQHGVIHNIVDETGHSALGAVFFMVRPMSVPDDIQEKGSKLNGYMEAHCQRRENESIWAYNVRMRQEATKRWSIVTGSAHYGLNYLDEDDQKDIVATLFILILQIFGRLARVTDTIKPAPHVYFMDGAFRKQPEAEQGFDCLNALGLYLDNMMQDEKNSEIAKTLYKPFYEAYKKGISYGR